MTVWPEAERNSIYLFSTFQSKLTTKDTRNMWIIFLMPIQTYVSWLLPDFTEGTYGSVFCMRATPYHVCKCEERRWKGSLSLDDSARCLLKSLLEQQQSHTPRVPARLISCCHFSSCSPVNHLSRSPRRNQLNSVIKWRKLKNAAGRGFGQQKL